jgi:hypothetical protein
VYECDFDSFWPSGMELNGYVAAWKEGWRGKNGYKEEMTEKFVLAARACNPGPCFPPCLTEMQTRNFLSNVISEWPSPTVCQFCACLDSFFLSPNHIRQWNTCSFPQNL